MTGEVVTRDDGSPAPGTDVTTLSEHTQDTIVNRLESVLRWAHARYSGDGWGRYLTTTGVDWTLVHLAGHSNGTSHSAFMGTLPEFRSIGRVALFAGPDDGEGGTTEDEWNPATYIQESQEPEVDTGTRYYGLVHVLNKAREIKTGKLVEPSPVYQVLKNWRTFGMEGPNNAGRFDQYDPEPGDTPDFGDAHMLVSIDPERLHATDPPLGTTKGEAHASVVKDVYCSEEDDVYDCTTYGDTKIGYEPAWRCILGTGDACVSSSPVADAGPEQTVECQGGGGAEVDLDGSGSRDVDCDVLTYAWTGPFGQASGKKSTVFAPLGSSTVILQVEDPWASSPTCPTSSAPDTTLISVRDTQPPSLQVTLAATVLWPPDHRLVRVDAAVSVADTCGDAPPQVVLTSVTSDQPDNGVADGDTDHDIQEADPGSFDTSILVRAERAGNDPRGRTYTLTYTATDASGNQTQTSATVHVPLSQ